MTTPGQPAFAVGSRVYYDARSRPVPYDGSPVTWRVGAYALALREGRVLMVRLGGGVHWELPGGGVEPTEPIGEAAAREVLEETGYRFVPDPGPPAHSDEMWFWKRGGATVHHSLLFIVRGRVEGEPDAGWRPLRQGEIGAVAWVDPRALREEEAHPRYWAALRAVGLVDPCRLGRYEAGAVAGRVATLGRRFVDPSGAEVPFDGASPVTWRPSAHVLVVRDGRVLMVRQTAEWGGRWELPGGQVEVEEGLVEGAARECREETGYRFVASSPAPVHAQEAWFVGPAGFRHAVLFVFRGEVVGEPDPGWALDGGEVAQVAWIDPRELTAATTRALHWPALQKAGLV